MPLFHMLAEGQDAHRTALFAHGILGSGKNWRSFFRQLVQRRPEWRVVMVDLRNHGRSARLPGPHTLAACAEDLRQLAVELDLKVDAVLGHSFGGKVALEYARRYGEHLSQVWTLDTTPGALGIAMDDSDVVQVMRALREIPQPLQRRDALIPLLTERGLSMGIARWMTTNLGQSPDGLRWRFDLDAVEEMIGDYFQQDYWPLLEHPPWGLELHVVQAERSDRWTEQELAHFQDLPPWSTVHHHLLEDAGHWLHVDNPRGLMELLEDELH